MKFLIAIIISFLPFTKTIADDSTAYVGTTMHTIRIYEGGSIEEALKLSNQWRTRVLDQIPQFSKVSYLLNKESDTVYKLLVVREMRPESENVKSKSIGQAIAEGFKNETERDTFFKTLNQYIDPKENIVTQYEVVNR